jgi:uncharacterized membrane protein YfcA
MNRDRTAFVFGVFALVLAGLALWANYGRLEWNLVGVLVPAAMVVAGVGVLVLSRPRN